MDSYDSDEHIGRASTLRMIIFGVLVFWAPYVFIWFVLRPTYPKWYRVAAAIWAVFWVACIVIYIAAGMLGHAY